jgi:hypothetical protein
MELNNHLHVAFPATEYDEVLLGYQMGQMVERWKNQRFEDQTSTLRTITEMVFEMLDFSTTQPFDPAEPERTSSFAFWCSQVCDKIFHIGFKGIYWNKRKKQDVPFLL